MGMAFITIEGIEGAGKSTLRTKLSERLSSLGKEVVLTREPGATELGQALRTILLDAKRTNLDPLAELLLFFADRAQHLSEIVRPALQRGAIILCDRYIHSTIAYQGYGRGIPLEPLANLTSFATGGLRPDLVLLLDLDPQTGLSRARKRTAAADAALGQAVLSTNPGEPGTAADESWNRFEQQELSFHTVVRRGFLELAAEPSNNFLILDACCSPEDLADRAFKGITDTLERLR